MFGPIANRMINAPLGPPFPGLVERIVDSATPVIALETGRPGVLLEQLRQAALRHGRAIYLWSAADGIGSLREPGVFVPGTRHVIDALRHIEASAHFGIYVFSPLADLKLAPGSPALVVFRRFLQTRAAPACPRRIVLMDRYVGVDPEIDAQMERLFDRPGQGSLRLRQGRWVE